MLRSGGIAAPGLAALPPRPCGIAAPVVRHCRLGLAARVVRHCRSSVVVRIALRFCHWSFGFRVTAVFLLDGLHLAELHGEQCLSPDREDIVIGDSLDSDAETKVSVICKACNLFQPSQTRSALCIG